MANRNMFTDVASNHPGLVAVSGYFTFSADATPTCAITKSNGYILTCVQSAEGIYAVTFKDSWAACVGFDVVGLAGGNNVKITAQSLNDSTPTVTLLFEGDTGTDADPTSATCWMTFWMKNSSYANGA